MPIDENSESKNYIVVTPEHGQQLRRNMLDSINNLPSQDEIDFSKFADRDVFADVYGADWIAEAYRDDRPSYNSEHQEIKVLHSKYPTLKALLNETEDWAQIFRKWNHIDFYNRLCLTYGFHPDIPDTAFNPVEAQIENSREPNPGIDVQELDEILTSTLDLPVPFEEIGLAAKTIEKFKEAKIETVYDFIFSNHRRFKAYGIGLGSVRNVKVYLREKYGIDRESIAKNNVQREAIGTKYFIENAMNSVKEGSSVHHRVVHQIDPKV